ncbi:MAG TPA: hypothetical protein VGL77_04590 [Armatimonadota bacterium]|jgi:hypothetical protein
MQQERLRDPIDVVVVFSKGKMTPRHFRWANRTYAVDAVNQRWTGKNGGIQICYFAVSAVGNAYKLAFNTKELTWHLEEVYAA